jgi:FkbM family methyltransferase
MKKINDFYWPDHDADCHPVVPNQLEDLQYALTHVKNQNVCVQAGGNVGIWPKRLGELFKTVYTFEPDPENFNCLARNVTDHNIVKLNAGLSNKHELITVKSPNVVHDNNCGAYQVTQGGQIPTFKIDDLNLTECDLIYLDIEGYELYALEGAVETITKFKPIIALEQKFLPIMYQDNPEAASEWLIENHNYEVVERIHRDIVLAPRGD